MNKLVRTHIGSSKSAWIGLQSTTRGPAWQWEWVSTGQLVNQVMWASADNNPPDHSDNASCVYAQNLLWYNTPCNEKRNFVCEFFFAPTSLPSGQPTRQPTGQPTLVPTSRPTGNCPAGSYFVYDQNTCILCESGKASAVQGSMDPEVCETCAVGSWALAGAVECTPCLPGYASPYAGAVGLGACKQCPIGFYQPGEGKGECIKCPQGRITPDPASTHLEECVSPEVNFYTGSVVLVFTFIFALDYVGNGRFSRIAFLRQERVTRHLLGTARTVITYLENYRYKAEADRVYLTSMRMFRVTLFLLLSCVLIALLIIVHSIMLLFRVIFKAMIVLASLSIKIPFLNKIDSLLLVLSEVLQMNFLYYYLLLPFGLVIRFLAALELDFSAVNVTCDGATAPLKLLINVIIMGVVIIIISSEYQLYTLITQTMLTKRFAQVISSPSYRRRCLYKNREIHEKMNKAWVVSTKYLYTLFITLINISGEKFDVMHVSMQFFVSLVKLRDFVEWNGIMHAYSESCNLVKGFENFDIRIAYGASILAWIIFFPAAYEIANVLIPGTYPGAAPLVAQDKKVAANFKQKGYSMFLYHCFRKAFRWSSVYAFDLWWAESRRRWMEFITKKAPYDVNLCAPGLDGAKAVSELMVKAEDEKLFNPKILHSETALDAYEMSTSETTTKLSISLTTPTFGNEWNGMESGEGKEDVDGVQSADTLADGDREVYEDEDDDVGNSSDAKDKGQRQLSAVDGAARRPSKAGNNHENITQAQKMTNVGLARSDDRVFRFSRVLFGNKKANKVMSLIEHPDVPTYRVALGRDDIDLVGKTEGADVKDVFAKVIADALAMSKEKAVFFSATRALLDQFKWSIVPRVQTLASNFRGRPSCFTFVRISGTTGKVDFNRVFDFSLPYDYPNGAEGLVHELNASKANSIVLLYSNGCVYPVGDNDQGDDKGMEGDWDAAIESEGSDMKERAQSTKKVRRSGERGAAWRACQREEMRTALRRCGGNPEILEKAVVYVLIGVPDSGADQGHQCYYQIDDKDKTLWCSSRGMRAVSTGSAMVDKSDEDISDILVDVQFSVLNVDSSVFPLDFQICNSPYNTKQSVWCLNKNSYVSTPLHTSNTQEDRKWLQRRREGLPSYFGLLALEQEEMYLAYNYVVHDLCCCPHWKITAALIDLPFVIITSVLAFVGAGHLLSSVGRRVWTLMAWKYARFLLLCCGFWTEEVVEMMLIHKYVKDYSLIMGHPSVKIKDAFQTCGMNWKAIGVRGSIVTMSESSSKRRKSSVNMGSYISDHQDEAREDMFDDPNATLTHQSTQYGPDEEGHEGDTSVHSMHNPILRNKNEEWCGAEVDGVPASLEMVRLDENGGQRSQSIYRIDPDSYVQNPLQRGSLGGEGGSDPVDGSPEYTGRESESAGKQPSLRNSLLREQLAEIRRGSRKDNLGSTIHEREKRALIEEQYSSVTAAAMPITELQQLMGLEYSQTLMAMMGTRAILVQMVPWLAFLSVFCEFTARAPMFVFDETLRLRLPEMIVPNPFELARKIEQEFTASVAHIRQHELEVTDHCFLNPEEYADVNDNVLPIKESIRRSVNRENLMNIKRLTLAKKQVLKPREWAVVLRGNGIFLLHSRLIDFIIQSCQYSLIVFILFLSNEHHRMIIALTIFLSIPNAVVSGIDVIIGLGQTLAITDDDLVYTWKALVACCAFVWCCGRKLSTSRGTRAPRRGDMDVNEGLKRTPWVYPHGYKKYYNHCIRVLNDQGANISSSTYHPGDTPPRDSTSLRHSSFSDTEGFTFSMNNFVDSQLTGDEDPLRFTTSGVIDDRYSMSVPDDAYTVNPLMKRGSPSIKLGSVPRKAQPRKTALTPVRDSHIVERSDEEDLRMTIQELDENAGEDVDEDEVDDEYSSLPSMPLPTLANKSKTSRRRSSAFMSHLDPTQFMEEVDIRMSVAEHEDEGYEFRNAEVTDMAVDMELSLDMEGSLSDEETTNGLALPEQKVRLVESPLHDDVPPVADDVPPQGEVETGRTAYYSDSAAAKVLEKRDPALKNRWDGVLASMKHGMPKRPKKSDGREKDDDDDEAEYSL